MIEQQKKQISLNRLLKLSYIPPLHDIIEKYRNF